jgi:uncharacterized membrane protein
MAERKISRMNTRHWGLLLSSIGLFDSGYLSWIQISHSVEKCIPGLGDCATVNASSYSRLYGVPVAYLGFLTYFVIFTLLLIQPRFVKFSKFENYLLFGITMTGFLFSVYLTYVQFGLLKAFCPYCLLSAGTTTGLFILSIIYLKKDFNTI